MRCPLDGLLVISLFIPWRPATPIVELLGTWPRRCPGKCVVVLRPPQSEIVETDTRSGLAVSEKRCAESGRRLPARASFPVPIPPGLAGEPPFSTAADAAAPCWPGTWNRRSRGSSWPLRGELVPRHKSRNPGPMEDPIPLGPGWKTPMTLLRAETWVHSPQQLDRQRNPPRHRLAEAVAAPGPLWNRVWLCPNPGRNPSPTWRSPTMPRHKNPIHTPVSSP